LLAIPAHQWNELQASFPLSEIGFMISKKSLDARLRPTAAQQDALKLACQTGMLHRLNGGIWAPRDAAGRLPESSAFPHALTTTIRACINRCWLERRSRDLVSITEVGKRALARARRRKKAAAPSRSSQNASSRC